MYVYLYKKLPNFSYFERLSFILYIIIHIKIIPNKEFYVQI